MTHDVETEMYKDLDNVRRYNPPEIPIRHQD